MLTDGRTDITRYIISLASLSIKIVANSTKNLRITLFKIVFEFLIYIFMVFVSIFNIQISHTYFFSDHPSLGHTHYILWLMIPPMSWNQARQERKIDDSAFFYFLLRHDINIPWKYILFLLFFFPSSDISWQAYFIYLFFSFRRARKPLVGIRQP